MYEAENKGKGKDKEKKEERNCSVCFDKIYFHVHEDFEYLYVCTVCLEVRRHCLCSICMQLPNRPVKGSASPCSRTMEL